MIIIVLYSYLLHACLQGRKLGLRYSSNNRVLTAEAVGFLIQFEDLIVVDNIGGTGTGNYENFGEVDSYGLELSGQG